jgi:hypothetical protein
MPINNNDPDDNHSNDDEEADQNKKPKERTLFGLQSEHNKAMKAVNTEFDSILKERVKELDKSTNKGGKCERISHSRYESRRRSITRKVNTELTYAKSKVHVDHPAPKIKNPHIRLQSKAIRLLLTSKLEGKSNSEAYKILCSKKIEQKRYNAFKKEWIHGEIDIIDKSFIDVSKGRYPANWIDFDELFLSAPVREFKESRLFPKYSYEYYRKGTVSQVLSKFGNLYDSVNALRENQSSKQKDREIEQLKLKIIQLQSAIKDPQGWHEIVEDGLKEGKVRKSVIFQVQSLYDVKKQVIIDFWKNRNTKMRNERDSKYEPDPVKKSV